MRPQRHRDTHGRLSAFATRIVLIMALAGGQGLLADLLGDAEIAGGGMSSLTTGLGAIYGLLIAVPLGLGRHPIDAPPRRGRKLLLHALLWLALLIGLRWGARVGAVRAGIFGGP